MWFSLLLLRQIGIWANVSFVFKYSVNETIWLSKLRSIVLRKLEKKGFVINNSDNTLKPIKDASRHHHSQSKRAPPPHAHFKKRWYVPAPLPNKRWLLILMVCTEIIESLRKAIWSQNVQDNLVSLIRFDKFWSWSLISSIKLFLHCRGSVVVRYFTTWRHRPKMDTIYDGIVW